MRGEDVRCELCGQITRYSKAARCAACETVHAMVLVRQNVAAEALRRLGWTVTPPQPKIPK